LKKAQGRGAIDILEEAVGLVRGVSLDAYALYMAGAVPFVLGLLYFLADMTRNPFAMERLPAESLALALLYIWKNAFQSAFIARLYDQLSPSARPKGTVRSIILHAAIQPFGLILPLPWLVAFFRNLTLFAGLGRRDAMRAAFREAGKGSGQNWAMCAFVFLLAVLLFFNFLVMIAILPQLGRTFLGIEGDLARLGLRILNVTTVSVAAALAWFVIDPLLDAVYALRVFYSESVETGGDLRAALRRMAAAIVIACVLLGAPEVRAQDPSPAPVSIDKQQLDQKIESVLHRREFTWRMPRTGAEPEGKWVGWYRSVVDVVKNLIKWVQDLIDELMKPKETRGSRADETGIARKTMLMLIVGIIAVIVGGILVYYLRRRKAHMVVAQAVVTAAPAVNLADESLTADKLPESEWLALADELMTKGDFRFALRALYLAGLNHLSSRDLISLRRWKTGLDYRRELARRSRGNVELTGAFAGNVAIFEKGWYGRHDVDRETVELFARGLAALRLRESK
jgi:LPXTG-motif cell wall-anchored protein